VLKILIRIPLTLASFTFKGLLDYYDSDSVEKHVAKLIQKHKRTLQSLDVDHCLWDTETFHTLILPNLQNFRFNAKGFEIEKVSSFLAKQPPLKSLEMKFTLVVTSGQSLLAPLSHHAPLLEKFSLHWKLNPNEEMEQDDVVPLPFGFHFLKCFYKLREVKISQAAVFENRRLMPSGRRTCRDILSCLPGNFYFENLLYIAPNCF